MKQAHQFKISPDFAVCLFLALSVLIVYWQVLHYGFISLDDPMYVTENRHIRAGLTLESITWAFDLADKRGAYWQPLTWLSHMLDCHLYGLNAGMHHLTSVMIHIANSILLFLVFRRMTGELWKSAFVAALFALHPLNVDSVAWISERKNVLSTFFWMLTMLAYVCYTEKPGFLRYAAVFFSFLAGLMIKPMLVTLPCVLLLLDYWPLNRYHNWKLETGSGKPGSLKLITEKIPLFALSAASVFLALLSLKLYGGMESERIVPMDIRFANALVSYTDYLWKMIWPQNLAIYYPYPGSLPIWQTVGAGMFLVSASVLIIRMSGRMPCLVTGWLWYLGTLVPVSGIVQAGLWPAMADRWAYIPLIGIFVMIAWGIPEIRIKGKGLRVKGKRLRTKAPVPELVEGNLLVLALLLILMAASWHQVQYWKNNMTLFQHTLDVTYDNPIARTHLGMAMDNRGHSDEAIHHYREALQTDPDNLEAHNNLGIVLMKQGRTEEAATHWARVLQINPGYAPAHINMGLALARQDRMTQAIRHYSGALQLEPDNILAHKNLGFVLAKLQKYDEAVIHLQKALQIKPDQADIHNILASIHNSIATDLAKQGKTDEAIRHYSEALRSDPGYAETYYNMGVTLTLQGKRTEAIRYYYKALAMAPDDPGIHNNLGVALLNSGELEEAVAHFQKALEKDPDYAEADGNLKRAYRVLEKMNKAVTDIREKIRLDPGNPDLLYELGNLHRRHGQVNEAIAQYQKALSVQPESARVLNSLAVMHAVRGEYDNALSLLKKMAKLQPDNSDVSYSIACIFARQKKTETSVEWLKKAVEQGYENWKVLKTDENLENIRSTSYYKELIRSVKRDGDGIMREIRE